jgi:hypothetical protein
MLDFWCTTSASPHEPSVSTSPISQRFIPFIRRRPLISLTSNTNQLCDSCLRTPRKPSQANPLQVVFKLIPTTLSVALERKMQITAQQMSSKCSTKLRGLHGKRPASRGKGFIRNQKAKIRIPAVEFPPTLRGGRVFVHNFPSFIRTTTSVSTRLRIRF